MRLADPTTLIIIDEADRLRMASLEQVRAIFDAGDIGVILIGMPGLEKKLARYPQFYSRIGFVHEFRPLSTLQIRQLLEQRWTPPDVNLPQQPWAEEVIAAIIRITSGNFRLLNRLLTQMERVLEINGLHESPRPWWKQLGRTWRSARHNDPITVEVASRQDSTSLYEARGFRLAINSPRR